MKASHHGQVLYYDSSKLKIGGVMRYTITGDDLSNALFCRVRNTELSALRAAYLNGPYNLYVDMRPEDYNEHKKVTGAAKPVYNYHVKPGQHFGFELPVLHRKQTWIVTIQCEIMFSRSAEINFDITIGNSEHSAKLHGSQLKKHFQISSQLAVIKQDTAAIWQTPFPRPNEPLHICVLTHGLVSNVTADLLYLKETVDRAAERSGENLICKGYTGNVCRTGRGIKYLGRRLAQWIMDELIPTYKPQKLSFLAHSLGGPTQMYALGYIEATNPKILEGIELVNFVAFASPFLGISAENPGYVQFALDFGVVGKSGRDLGLSWTPGKQRPLLERLPGDHTLTILRRFKHRTLYANAVHDGIVPLRTSALVFLDYYAIAEANEAHKSGKKHLLHYRQTHKDINEQSALEAKEEVEREQDKRQRYENKLEQKFLKNNEFHEGDNESDMASIGANEHKVPSTSMDTKSSSTGETPTESLKSFLFERKQAKVFSRYQTVNDIDKASGVGETLPHKTSLIENGIFILLPPHPNSDFITDPGSREDVIFHDRVYSEKDLPRKRYKTTLIGALSGNKNSQVEIAKREERIARKYHTDLSWRKVLVSLLPEAHNNIVVRRRFSNAYGWPVVHHCVDEHFLKNEDNGIKKNYHDLNESDQISEQVAAVDINGDSRNDIQDPTSTIGEHHLGKSSSFSSTTTRDDPPWSESEDDIESEPDTDHDPQRSSMLKIIRN